MKPLPIRWFGPALLSLTAIAVRADDLKDARSSFIQSHADDKVEWHLWNDASIAQAAAQHKPIYLHIGAFTNELSRAMQTQSFVNPKVFGSLNQNYICILIDRDTQPGVAALFQAYLRSEKQSSGWPANLWLTPDLKPYEGSTYLPPSEEWGKEGILNVIDRLTPTWKNSQAAAIQRANDAALSTKSSEATEKGPDFSKDKTKASLATLRTAWWEKHQAAKTLLDDSTGHLDPEMLRWLLTQSDDSGKAALQVLHGLDVSALHDPLDGGFFHRGMTPAADFPSFQKYLGDQARLALAFLDAAKISADQSYIDGAESALDYVLSNLIRPEGGFIHAEDASPEDRVASFAWTKAQIDEALGEKESALFSPIYQVKAEGNISAENDPSGKWKGKNLLIADSVAGASAKNKTLAVDRAKLLEIRRHRLPPLRDEAVLIGENGLLLAALAQAGSQLKEPRFTEAAKNLAAFLKSKGGQADNSLLHSVGNSERATAEDDADVAYGFAVFAELDSADANRKVAANLLEDEQRDLFDVQAGRFFAQYENAPHLWLRTHTLDPLPGETPPAETATLLASLALKRDVKEIPASLLSTLAAALNDPNGTPRGDVLLAAALLVEAK